MCYLVRVLRGKRYKSFSFLSQVKEMHVFEKKKQCRKEDAHKNALQIMQPQTFL